MQGIGIGPALRRARLQRGKSIEEVSRETRIRAEYLQALERERFEEMLGDVYVRGFLRSYSTYLGLDAGKVLTVYNRHFGGPRMTLPEPTPSPIRSPTSPHPHLPTLMRHHPSWTFLIGVAMLVLAVFAAVGLLSRSKSAPQTENVGGAAPTLSVLPPSVTVALKATEEVRATILIDGGPQVVFLLRKDEGRSFEGAEVIEVRLDHGGTTELTVNAEPLGKPGGKDRPYAASFHPRDYRGQPSGNSP